MNVEFLGWGVDSSSFSLKVPAFNPDPAKVAAPASGGADWSSVLTSSITAVGNVAQSVIGALSLKGQQERSLTQTTGQKAGDIATSLLPIAAIAALGIGAVMLLRK